jgi:hypothetical protein
MPKKYVSSVNAEEAEGCPHGIWYLLGYIHAITYATKSRKYMFFSGIFTPQSQNYVFVKRKEAYPGMMMSISGWSNR